MTDSITQIIYRSTAVVKFDETSLNKILEIAREENQKRGITGFLIFDGAEFVQVLEGEHDTVMDLYAKVQKDSRHNNLELMFRDTVANRAFGLWAMAYVVAQPGSIRKLGGTMKPGGMREFAACLRDSASPTRAVVSEFLEGILSDPSLASRAAS